MTNVYVKEVAEGWMAMCGKCGNEITGKQCKCGYTGYPEYQERHDKVVKRSVRSDVFEKQVGGDHYAKQAIQPIEYIMANGISFCEGNVIKYVTRWKDKGGVDDLKKARHYLDMLIEAQGK